LQKPKELGQLIVGIPFAISCGWHQPTLKLPPCPRYDAFLRGHLEHETNFKCWLPGQAKRFQIFKLSTVEWKCSNLNFQIAKSQTLPKPPVILLHHRCQKLHALRERLNDLIIAMLKDKGATQQKGSMR